MTGTGPHAMPWFDEREPLAQTLAFEAERSSTFFPQINGKRNKFSLHHPCERQNLVTQTVRRALTWYGSNKANKPNSVWLDSTGAD